MTSVPLYLSFFRTILIIGLLINANEFLSLDIASHLIISSTVLSVFLTNYIYQKKLSFYGYLLSITILFFMGWLLSFLWSGLGQYVWQKIFYQDIVLDSFFLFSLIFVLVSFSTWFFLRIPGAPTIEAVFLLFVTLISLADHRNFHLDKPELLANLAWVLAIEPVSVFIVAGFFLFLLLIIYLFFISKWENRNYKSANNQSHFLNYQSLTTLLVITGLLFLSLRYLYHYYYQIQKNLVSNGVGLESSPGLSPLGFNSALGSTNQPSALVRLDGDYTNNPFSPMLYFRENALSQLKGTELVIASVSFDTDLHRTSPNEPFIIDHNLVPFRKKLSLSAYLLADHNLSFAIDYPVSIQPLKNPKPDRFKSAFQAVSLVPTIDLKQIEELPTTNPNWNKDIYQHYTQTVEDPRYHELALRITQNAPTAINKAKAVSNYLSEKSIYTLTPNHAVKKTDDQVAPYLFGDMRGYCVHFAHATVFMLRALGIPSRIGTGYLTDLSRSKDGHILLRMSDRHAWAEVYVNTVGWIPFDTKPTQVESHGDSEVDMKLLEELMGMIHEDQIMLPEQKELNEPGLYDLTQKDWELPNIPIVPIIVIMLVLLILNKIFIRYAYLLPSGDRKKIKRYYRSACSMLFDLGLTRKIAETRVEYAYRLSQENGLVGFLPLVEQSLKAKYGSTLDLNLNICKVSHANIRNQLNQSLNSRLINLFNPTSIYYAFKNHW